MAQKFHTDLSLMVGMNIQELVRNSRKAERRMQSFQNAFTKISGALGVAFGAQAFGGFLKNSILAAAKLEGIRAAFDRLNKPDLLDEMRKATSGTVSDLNLMQAAVRAKNFKIPLDRLATFFQFAADRATQTGESVDYLVESIINGIGRKSTLVMDNLGISAAELQEEIKKVGDFGQAAGNIIERAMAESGPVMETTATKIDRLAAKWENLKVSVGEALIDMVDFIEKAGRATARGLSGGKLGGPGVVVTKGVGPDPENIEKITIALKTASTEADHYVPRINLVSDSMSRVTQTTLGWSVAMANFQDVIRPIQEKVLPEFNNELMRFAGIGAAVGDVFAGLATDIIFSFRSVGQALAVFAKQMIAKLITITIVALAARVALSFLPGIGGAGKAVKESITLGKLLKAGLENAFGIPQLAEGGIVTQPTVAMIGEKGPEAVVPLNKGLKVMVTGRIVGSPRELAIVLDSEADAVFRGT